jgi:threonine dehydrogenase-like Zn-dependent dehydrogenase
MNEAIEKGCLLPYKGESFFEGALVEPLSCIIAGFKANFHLRDRNDYDHTMGIREGGAMAILGGTGPMGSLAIDYAIHCDRRPSLLVVTDIDEARLERAASIYTVEEAAKNGIELHYVNTRMENATEYLRSLTGGTGYDDVVCFAPVKPLIEQADDILGFDGCLNFFAGPTDNKFKAPFNWYNVHYLYTHVVGTSGGNTNDMQEAIEMMNAGKLNPSALVTHIGGLNAVIDTTLNLPKIPGGKKLIYNHIDLPLTAIADFEELGKTDPLFAELSRMCKENNGLWNPEAEKYLLANAKKI